MSKPEPALDRLRAPGFGEDALPPGRHGPAGPAGVRLWETALDAVDVSARRGGGDAIHDTFHSALGIALPVTGAAVEAQGLTAIGLAPQTWRILAAAGEPGALFARIRPAIARPEGAPASLVDVGDGLATLALEGPAAREALVRLCRLDLHPSRFMPGQAAQTVMAQIPALIWQIDATPRYALAVPLTLAQSFAHALIEACRPFGCDIHPLRTETP